MKSVLLRLMLVACTSLMGQVKVSGVVVDEDDNPIPYVNVLFANSTIGTTTNDYGEFELNSVKDQSTLSFELMGFQEKNIALKQNKSQYIKVILNEDSMNLDEVIIVKKPKKRLKKKDNPAYRILREIWKRKKRNGLDLVANYEYEKYSSRELGFGNMDSMFIKKVLRNKYDEMKGIVRQNYDNDTYYMPVELIEKVEKVYGSNSLKLIRKDMEALRETGIHQLGKYVARATNVFKEINVYKDEIPILDKTFVSPIATSGFGSYDYVLSDSIQIGKNKEYTIHFFPRQKGDLVFKGYFKVVDKNFTLSTIEMEILKEVNLNFVRDLSIHKTFELKNDSIYLPQKNIYKGEFTFLTKDKKEKSIYLVKKEAYSNYIFDKKRSRAFYENQLIQVSKNQFKKKKEYWQAKQDSSGKETLALVVKAKTSTKIKRVTGTIFTLSDGYFTPITGIQLGNLFTTTARNDIEGLRIRLGFRTFKTNDDRFRLLGFGAFGFKDNTFKYGFEARYLLTAHPRITVGAAYLNDVEQMGFTRFNEQNLIPQPDKGPKAVFVRGDNFFLSKVKKEMLRFDVEVFKNLNIGLKMARERISSADTKRFSMAFFNENRGIVEDKTTDVYSDLYVSYQPGRQVDGFGVDRILGPKLHSKILINYKKAYKNVFGGNVAYSKLSLLYNQPIHLGKFGVLDATLIMNKTFGKTPLSVLTAVASNQTYFLTPNTFALLDYYDYVADSSVETHLEHHFNGLLMNRIPLIKKLGLRSLLTFRTVYGSISEKNKRINKSSIRYAAPNKKPYYEYGIGIENIGYGNLRPLRVDFIWRSDFTNINGPISPKFGIRVGFKTSF
ncbi:DUF5686 and carboxypeptidase-like regulatory domain-containing protein [Tenacibaculum sp. 190524A02b]|uniref:CarboxypepD_reg-like domain-containing protein n=1 Tax=Tenacibaculum vairaonense TaxID=3137860 RepID=A0ABM9PHS5_9FLAO